MWIFLCMNFVMLIGPYICGCIPMLFNLNSSKIRLVSVFGGGLLLGAALTVIIPEGIDTLYEAKKLSALSEIKTEDASNENINKSIHSSSSVGPILVFGFILMFLIDQIEVIYISLRRFIHLVYACMCREKAEAGLGGAWVQNGGAQKSELITTLGLVIHSAADGIAFGSASALSNMNLEFLVFAAIILHKAPAALGLVSYLMHKKLSRSSIRKHLLAFCLAAPFAALATYVVVLSPSFFVDSSTSSASSDKESKNATFLWTGNALLFSGGTFLYVAASHVLPELAKSSGNVNSNSVSGQSPSTPVQMTEEGREMMNSSTEDLLPSATLTNNTNNTYPFSMLECALLTAGAFFPLLIEVEK